MAVLSARCCGRAPKLQTLGQVTREAGAVEPRPGEADVTVGTQEKKRGPRDPRAGELPSVDRLVGNAMRQEKFPEAGSFGDGRRNSLPDHDQIETCIVEPPEQVLDRSPRCEAKPQPREAARGAPSGRSDRVSESGLAR